MAKGKVFIFTFGFSLGIAAAAMISFYINAGPSRNAISSNVHGVKPENLPVNDDSPPNEVTMKAATETSPFVVVEESDKDDNETAEQLYNKVRILCWIMTSPNNLMIRAKHVRDTWSKRCNIRVFFSSVEDKDFPAVGLPVGEGRDQLYEKVKRAFRYVWEHYSKEADWFMKADDDSFVIMENLRYLLKDYDPNTPIYFGRVFTPYVKQGYMSGGAGYVLSKESTKRFAHGLHILCKRGGGVEDLEIGKCLSLLGVVPGDSRDETEKEMFHPLSPAYHLIPGRMPDWYWKYNLHETCSGRECITEYPISFHYVKPDDMHVFEYMFYKAKVYGMSHAYKRYPTLPYKLSLNKK